MSFEKIEPNSTRDLKIGSRFDPLNKTTQSGRVTTVGSRKVTFVKHSPDIKSFKGVMNEMASISTKALRKVSTKSIEPLESNYERLLMRTTKRSDGRFNL